MSVSPAQPRKCHFPSVSCEQLLTQPFPEESLGLWDENTSWCTPGHATLHCSQPLDTHFKNSILACDNEVGKVFISKNLFRGKKNLIGQNLFILRCILNCQKMLPSNNKLRRATFQTQIKCMLEIPPPPVQHLFQGRHIPYMSGFSMQSYDQT